MASPHRKEGAQPLLLPKQAAAIDYLTGGASLFTGDFLQDRKFVEHVKRDAGGLPVGVSDHVEREVPGRLPAHAARNLRPPNLELRAEVPALGGQFGIGGLVDLREPYRPEEAREITLASLRRGT
jgi:hypothetical protein